jgi:6-phosphogluconolactonase
MTGPGAKKVEVFDNLVLLTRRAAQEVLQRAEAAVARREQFTLALSGGSTPRGLYELLVSDEYRARIPWRRAHFFWGDERSVPPDHPDSNFGMVRSAMLSKVEVPAENIHRIEAELPASVAAQAYEEHIRAFFRLKPGQGPPFDLALLGLGADAHTASLFPGMEAVREKERLVIATSAPKLGSPRITLTPPALNAAAEVMFLVAGADKASALAAVRQGPIDRDRYPAQAIAPSHGSVLWLVDEAAASRLQR